MYLPSFFTGYLIKRTNEYVIILIGMAIFGGGLGLYFVGKNTKKT